MHRTHILQQRRLSLIAKISEPITRPLFGSVPPGGVVLRVATNIATIRVAH